MRRTVIKGKMGHRERTLVIEEYRTFDELLRTNDSRRYNNFAKYRREYDEPDFNGVKSYEEAVNMLKYGYAPNLKNDINRINKSIKSMTAVKTRPVNDIVGYMPHVPNAIIGIPQQMINSQRTIRKTKVVKMIVDIGILSNRSGREVDEWGIELITKIINLEMQGYRVRLEYLKTMSNDITDEMYLLRVLLKNEANAFDLKRMAFPIAHISMQRVIAWDWYERLPEAKWIDGFGRSLSTGGRKELERRKFIEEKICDKDTVFMCIFDNIEEKLSGIK